MSRFYDPDAYQQLRDLIDQVSCNETRILIPDLQRAYVWTPDRVILLVDSLFRDWPFGSLLTWNYVTPEGHPESEYGIPARAFDCLVSRVKDVSHMPFRKRDQQLKQTGDIMVLDGQQRVQSLVLAFAKGAGLCLYDHEWNAALHPELNRSKPTDQYTHGVLCLNVLSAVREMQANKGTCGTLDMQKVLEWVAVDQSLSSHAKLSDGPLPCFDSTDSRFIRLADLWSLAGRTSSFTDLKEIIRDDLVKKFGGISWLAIAGADENLGLERLTTIVARLGSVRELKVCQLQVNCFSPTSTDPTRIEQERDAYDQAIVSIFTRLNTAGRVLTDAEITYAWLKVGWEKARSTDPEKIYPAPAQSFIGRIAEFFGYLGKDDNDAIDAMSLYWCICKRSGKLLELKDFVRGDVIRPMAAFLYARSRKIESSTEIVAGTIEGVLADGRISSFNAVEVALAFYLLGGDTCANFTTKHPEHSTVAREKPMMILNDVFGRFADRWFYVTAFSGKWATSAGAYLSDLAKRMSDFIKKDTPEDVLSYEKALTDFSDELISTAVPGALNAVMENVDDRSLVSQYANRLLVWQRIDETRAKYRDLTFGPQGSRAKKKLQVDHVIAHAAWCQYVDQLFAAKEISTMQALEIFSTLTPEEGAKLSLDPDKANEDAKRYAKAFINRIGNCSLLNNRYNAAKSKNNMLDFMSLVHGFEDDVVRSQWQTAMGLTDVFLSPFVLNADGSVIPRFSLMDYVSAIKNREAAILSDLRKYISGDKDYSRLH